MVHADVVTDRSIRFILWNNEETGLNGARAYVDGPRGIFTLQPHESATGIGLIAGGVGIAPILGILRQMRANGDPRPVRLIFANRHAGQIPYRDELDGLSVSLDYRVHYVL